MSSEQDEQRQRKLPVRAILLASVCLVLAATATAPARAQFQPWEGSEILQDPEWRMRFLGSYGFLSGAEPPVKQQELGMLREVIDLMKVNLPAATARLQAAQGPDSSAALDFILANLHFQAGALPEAKAAYESALGKFPDFRRAHKNLGLLLVQEQDFAGGAEHLAQAVELGDRGGRNFGLLGYCYLNLEKYYAAEAAYRNALMQEPDSRDWKLGLARSLLAMNKQAEAVALFDGMIADDPEDSTAWMLQANAYLSLERPDAAAVNLEAVRMMGKAQPSTLKLLGDIYMNEQQYWLARDAYVELIEMDGGADFASAQRAADLLIRTRAYDEAGDVINATRKRFEGKLDNEEQLELLTLTARLARSQGNDKEAAKLLESIVKRDGTRGDALLELAKYHQSVGQTERAIFLIERAEKIEAWEYRALLDHAQVMVSERDYTRAAELLRRALAIKAEPRVERFLASVESAMDPT
jgi:tetratricopeptide (TPR) repeat protein